MFRNFGLCKRPLLAVLGVLLASTLASANAATIDMSQLTSNGAKPVVISSTAANQNSAAPIVNIETNTQPTTKVANTPVSTPISVTPEKATFNPSTSQPQRMDRAINTPPQAAYTLPKLASGWKVGMMPYKNKIKAPAIR